METGLKTPWDLGMRLVGPVKRKSLSIKRTDMGFLEFFKRIFSKKPVKTVDEPNFYLVVGFDEAGKVFEYTVLVANGPADAREAFEHMYSMYEFNKIKVYLYRIR